MFRGHRGSTPITSSAASDVYKRQPTGGCDLRGKLHSYEYWEDIPGGFADDDMVEVNFKNTRKGYFLNSGKIPQ